MKHLYSKKISKAKEDVQGYLCLFCQSCLFGCSNSCAQACSSCGGCDACCTTAQSIAGYGS